MTTSLFFTAIAAMLVGCAVADRSLLAAPSTPDIYSTGLQPSGACDLAKARWWGCKKQADRLYPGSNGYVIRFANISGCLDTLFDDFCGPDTDISSEYTTATAGRLKRCNLPQTIPGQAKLTRESFPHVDAYVLRCFPFAFHKNRHPPRSTQTSAPSWS